MVLGVSVWCSVCRDFGDGCAGCGFVDDGLVGGEGGDEGLQGEIVDRAGYGRPTSSGQSGWYPVAARAVCSSGLR